MKNSRIIKIAAIGCISTVISFVTWALTNNAVSECSSSVGVFAQTVNTQVYNNCATDSTIHSFGLGIMVAAITELVVTVIYGLMRAR